MARGVAQKILEAHIVEGKWDPGKEIAIKIDQTLTQDATGTMAYLQFEAMDVPRVKTDLSVSYVDHNTLQTGFENADDHLYLRTLHDGFHPHWPDEMLFDLQADPHEQVNLVDDVHHRPGSRISRRPQARSIIDVE